MVRKHMVPLHGRWISRGHSRTWTSEHRLFRRGLCSPVGIDRGPLNPIQDLWDIRVSEGCTESGWTFAVTDNWKTQKNGAGDMEPWTGKTTFYARKVGKLQHNVLVLDCKSSRIQIGSLVSSSMQGSPGEMDVDVGQTVEVMGHGIGTVTCMGCCGYKGAAEVACDDGSMHHISCMQDLRGSMQSNANIAGDVENSRKVQWADAEDSGRPGIE